MNCYRDGGLKRPFLHKAALLANIPDQGLSLPRPLTISTLGTGSVTRDPAGASEPDLGIYVYLLHVYTCDNKEYG